MLLIIRKITVKSGREISHFSPTGLVFDDGSRVEADLVIFATGYAFQRPMRLIRQTLMQGFQVFEDYHQTRR